MSILTRARQRHGPGFGGKEDQTVQHFAALLAWLERRPVKCTLGRAESTRVHVKWHAMTINLRLGCDERITADTGAYASLGGTVLYLAVTHAGGPYVCRNIGVEGIAVHTNNPPAGAFRGFGVPQVNFALESALDALAEKVGLSPWEIRFRNAVRPSDSLPNGQAWPAVSRIPGSGAVCTGQTIATVLTQIACETLARGVDRVHVAIRDTATTPDSGTTTASRQTLITGEACRRACTAAAAALAALSEERTERGSVLAAGNGFPYSSLAGREFSGHYEAAQTLSKRTSSIRSGTLPTALRASSPFSAQTTGSRASWPRTIRASS